MIVAIGRIAFKPGTSRLAFYWHTLRSLIQVKRDPGCTASRLHRENRDTFWSFSLWKSREDMLRYRNRGAHLAAMRKTKQITSSAQFHHYEADALPTVEDGMRRFTEGRASSGRAG